MKIIRYELPEVTSVSSVTLAEIEHNEDVIIVEDSSGFSVDDFILIEERGSEYNEIVKITAINNNNISYTPNNKFPHSEGSIITKLNYDKFKIIRADKNGLYKKVIVEQELNYANSYGIINYIDDTENASDNMTYKIYYVNSETSTEDLQTTILEDTISNLSIDEFRRDSTFTTNQVLDSEISSALRAGLEWIQDNAYKTTIFETRQQNTTFTLNLNGMVLCDWNGDNEIDKNDMVVYEVETGTGKKYCLNHKIIKVFPLSNRILFKETVPTKHDRELVFLVKTTFRPLEEVRTTLKTIIKLVATNWIMRNVDTSRIKSGITSWSAGGTNVNRDVSAIKDSVDKNYQEAQRLLHQLLKIYMKPNKLRTTYSSLNWNMRNRGGFIGNKRF